MTGFENGKSQLTRVDSAVAVEGVHQKPEPEPDYKSQTGYLTRFSSILNKKCCREERWIFRI